MLGLLLSSPVGKSEPLVDRVLLRSLIFFSFSISFEIKFVLSATCLYFVFLESYGLPSEILPFGSVLLSEKYELFSTPLFDS